MIDELLKEFKSGHTSLYKILPMIASLQYETNIKVYPGYDKDSAFLCITVRPDVINKDEDYRKSCQIQRTINDRIKLNDDLIIECLYEIVNFLKQGRK